MIYSSRDVALAVFTMLVGALFLLLQEMLNHLGRGDFIKVYSRVEMWMPLATVVIALSWGAALIWG